MKKFKKFLKALTTADTYKMAGIVTLVYIPIIFVIGVVTCAKGNSEE